ncbi:hypothetical protein ACT6NV_00465 [Robiginitalea sp. IMCC44478]|uniref:hypothetical protein n=1 Tax=Robiginitalea sp. IMCC44478 TaxID=3459122 RepID=UPI004041AFD2
MNKPVIILLMCICFIGCSEPNAKKADTQDTFETDEYKDLVLLFQDWRQFENPPLFEGAPDYRQQTFDKRRPEFQALRSRLQQIDTANWDIPQQVDWMIVWAEMNGYDFNERILKPWQRDPAFYKSVWTARSDVPAHEGPTNHGTTELWTYQFPLTPEEKTRLEADLKRIPALNRQAQTNLVGNAKELWVAGIRDIKEQSEVLSSLANDPHISEDPELSRLVAEAKTATDELVSWLQAEAGNKTGPSGIGKENYSWYLQNVHLVPLSWEDEVLLLKRELARAWTALKFEEHKNRDLAELEDANSVEAYNAMADRAASSLISFLQEQQIVTVKPYFEPALREHLGSYIPREKRNFFVIGEHLDPRPLYSHFYHWFELARMDTEPNQSEIRRGPLLYNIFDSRNEGTATAVEEMFLQAGLYEDSPRSREIVYIMIAQRAARGLGSLYAHANLMSMEEAGGIHSEYTPRGWMKTEKELLLFEQHLYMRQPGYGSSYISGKYLLENALADYALQLENSGEPFVPKNFFDQLNKIGNIPVSLAQWELTGSKKALSPIISQK